MISLSRPHEDWVPPVGPGGFSWWYVDLVDEHGDGVVLIWGFALPFLAPPADASAMQSPFLTVAVYQGGRTTCFHLETLAPEDLALDGGGWRFGRSHLISRRRGDRWEVVAELDLPVAGASDRLRGELRVEGPVVRHGWDEAGPHRWAPLTLCAQGYARLARDDGWSTEIRGRAYHDRNTGELPLGRMGIAEWAWGRVALPDAELVHYVLWPEAQPHGPPRVLTLRSELDGATSVVEGGDVEGSGTVGGFWGLPTARTLQVGAQTPLVAGAAVDQSPFYLRFPLTTVDGAGRGWGERVRPGAIDLWWMRPFVRMRVMAPRGNSLLLPAFSGPRVDRVQRTLRGIFT